MCLEVNTVSLRRDRQILEKVKVLLLRGASQNITEMQKNQKRNYKDQDRDNGGMTMTDLVKLVACHDSPCYGCDIYTESAIKVARL